MSLIRPSRWCCHDVNRHTPEEIAELLNEGADAERERNQTREIVERMRDDERAEVAKANEDWMAERGRWQETVNQLVLQRRDAWDERDQLRAELERLGNFLRLALSLPGTPVADASSCDGRGASDSDGWTPELLPLLVPLYWALEGQR